MAYDIELKEILAQPTAHIRATIPAAEIGDTIGRLIPEVLDYLEQQGANPVGPPYARYYSYDPQGEADVEVGFPVPTRVAENDRVKSDDLPGGEVADTWHHGPYEEIVNAFRAVEAWIKDQSREPAGAPWEVYWTNPQDVPDPKDYRTEVIWSIK